MFLKISGRTGMSLTFFWEYVLEYFYYKAFSQYLKFSSHLCKLGYRINRNTIVGTKLNLLQTNLHMYTFFHVSLQMLRVASFSKATRPTHRQLFPTLVSCLALLSLLYCKLSCLLNLWHSGKVINLHLCRRKTLILKDKVVVKNVPKFLQQKILNSPVRSLIYSHFLLQ